MLSDQFMSMCGAACLDDSDFKDNVIKDIFAILQFQKEDKIPLSSRHKFDLTKTICRLRLEGKSRDEIIESIRLAGKYQDLDSYLKLLQRSKIPKEKQDNAVSQIRTRKKHVNLLKDFPRFETFIQKLTSNSFTDLESATKEWERLVDNMYSRVSAEKRNEASSRVELLDLFSDSYADVINQIEVSYVGNNSITTGYSQLDYYMNGGFEPSRLYIFGGSSGDGKSVLLMNMLKNAVGRNKDASDLMDIYVYVTMENLIDESLVRLYCSHTDKKIEQLIQNFQSEKHTIENHIKQWQADNNSIINMAYLTPTETTVNDVMAYIDEIKNRYKNVGKVKAVYIDYLDLLKAGQTFDLHRLEMGQITIDLKVMAVKLGIPVITATQLNRAGYDHSENLSLTQMSESIKKVENSDFVALLRAITDERKEGDNDNSALSEYGQLKIMIGKNRSGPKNKVVKLQTKFSHFQINDTSQIVAVPFEREPDPTQMTHDIPNGLF